MKIVLFLIIAIWFSLHSQASEGKNPLRELGEQLETALAELPAGFLTANRCGLGAMFSDDPENVVISTAPQQRSLRFGDRILSINTLTDGPIAERLSSIPPDSKVMVSLIRGGNEISVEIQCQDVATDYELQAQLAQALKRNRPSECMAVLEKLAQSSGTDAWFQDVHQNCLFQANRRNNAWRTHEYPRYVYLVFNQYIREEAAIAAHSEDGFLHFEELWPYVVTWMDDLRSRNAHTFASELRSEYNKQLEYLRGSKSVSSAKGPGRSGTVSSGTCFVVRPDGLVLTNHHVIANASEIVVTLSTGDRLTATTIASSEITDIALLGVRAEGLSYLPFSDLRSARVGMDVFTIGYPSVEILGAEEKFSSGVINALSGLQGEPSVMQISVPLQPGNSGGPLVNDRGEVVGIVTSTAAAGAFLAATGNLPQNINWAVKSDFAMAFFDAPSSLPPTRDREHAILRTKAAVCRVEASR